MRDATVATERGSVRVRGESLLARHLARTLDEAGDALDGSGAARVHVVRLDELDRRAPELPGGTDDAVLFVGLWRSWVHIGPVWRPGRPGCPRCLLTRLTGSPAGPDPVDIEADLPPGWDPSPMGCGPGVGRLVYILVRARLDELGSADRRWEDREVTVYGAGAGEAASYRLAPDPACTTCGRRERSTLPDLPDSGASPELPSGGPLRVRQPPAERVLDRVSPTGLFGEVRIDLQSPVGACSVEMPEYRGRPREPTMGQASSYRESRVIAVLEGLERHCGLHLGALHERVRAAYEEVADRAIRPTAFGVHPPESYAKEDFPFARFDPGTVVDWVEAYSFGDDRPVLVPESVAFWGPAPAGERFFQTTSNGCALGSCPEEAVLHGLREVIERDAFLLTWYHRLLLPEVDLRAGSPPEFRSLLDKCELFTGCEFRAHLSTMEHGVPSLWLTAVRDEGDGPATVAGAAAHPDPRRAARAALLELTQKVLGISHEFAERREVGLRMLESPRFVRTMSDHPLVNGLPEARERFSFLLDRDGRTVPLGDVPPLGEEGTGRDLRALLSTAVQGVQRAGMDVLAVDQTTPGVARDGFVCVKVLVPGLVPMTFGHANRRTENLPRLRDRSRLPHASALPARAGPRVIPHPFD